MYWKNHYQYSILETFKKTLPQQLSTHIVKSLFLEISKDLSNLNNQLLESKTRFFFVWILLLSRKNTGKNLNYTLQKYWVLEPWKWKYSIPIQFFEENFQNIENTNTQYWFESIENTNSIEYSYPASDMVYRRRTGEKGEEATAIDIKDQTNSRE